MSVGDFGMAELREFLEIVLMIHYSFIHHLFYFMQHNLIIMNDTFLYYCINRCGFLESKAVITL